MGERSRRREVKKSLNGDSPEIIFIMLLDDYPAWSEERMP
jgi:hypothetical protein